MVIIKRELKLEIDNVMRKVSNRQSRLFYLTTKGNVIYLLKNQLN